MSPAEFRAFLQDLRGWLDQCASAFNPPVLPRSKDWARTVTSAEPPGSITMEAHVKAATLTAAYTTGSAMITFQPRAAFNLTSWDFEAYYQHLVALADEVDLYAAA